MFQEPDATTADAPPETKGYVYLFRADTGVYKIGSSKDPSARLQSLGTMPFGLELLHQMPSNDPHWVERMLHKRFGPKRVRGEWFALDEREVAAIIATARCDRPGWVRRARVKRRRLPKADLSYAMARLSADVHGQLKILAERNNRPLTRELRALIIQHLEENDLWPPKDS